MLAALSQAPILVILGRRMGFPEYEIEVGEFVEVSRRPDRASLRVLRACSVGRSRTTSAATPQIGFTGDRRCPYASLGGSSQRR
ncbi:MAG: hypothetical protein U0271_33005 [Polyangiaceae bacterium]